MSKSCSKTACSDFRERCTPTAGSHRPVHTCDEGKSAFSRQLQPFYSKEKLVPWRKRVACTGAARNQRFALSVTVRCGDVRVLTSTCRDLGVLP